MGQIDHLYRIAVLIWVAYSELSGQLVENSGLQSKGDWIVPVHFVKQMSSGLNIWKRERQKREKDSNLQ